MVSRHFIAAALVLAFPAIAHAEHAEQKPDAPKKPAAQAAPATATPAKPSAKPTHKPGPKKVAAVEPKGAAPKKQLPLLPGPHAVAHPAAQAKPAVAPKPPCVKSPVEVTTGVDTASFVLGTCDGKPAPLAIEQLSVLARGGAPKPTQSAAELAKVPGTNIAKGIRRVDPGLVVRLQRVVDHFAKPGETMKIAIVSGYRPASAGSYHAVAKALDFRIEGVTNEALVAFCKTFDDTGCGYYPNSVFVHMDVREGAGHVSWIDASGPGERPRYVTTWPPPKTPSLSLPSNPYAPSPSGPTHSPAAIDPDDEPARAADDHGF
jgi:hypothetical protein